LSTAQERSTLALRVRSQRSRQLWHSRALIIGRSHCSVVTKSTHSSTLSVTKPRRGRAGFNQIFTREKNGFAHKIGQRITLSEDVPRRSTYISSVTRNGAKHFLFPPDAPEAQRAKQNVDVHIMSPTETKSCYNKPGEWLSLERNRISPEALSMLFKKIPTDYMSTLGKHERTFIPWRQGFTIHPQNDCRSLWQCARTRKAMF